MPCPRWRRKRRRPGTPVSSVGRREEGAGLALPALLSCEVRGPGQQESEPHQKVCLGDKAKEQRQRGAGTHRVRGSRGSRVGGGGDRRWWRTPGAPLYSALMDGVRCCGRGQGRGARPATLPYLVALAPSRTAEAIHGAKDRGEDQRGAPRPCKEGEGAARRMAKYGAREGHGKTG
jgi:hypothetical protein